MGKGGLDVPSKRSPKKKHGSNGSISDPVLDRPIRHANAQIFPKPEGEMK
jgi:hypothetical protein